MIKRYTAFFLATLFLGVFLPSIAEAQPVHLEDIESINAFDLHPNGRIIAIAGRVGNQYGFWLYNTTTKAINVIETEYPILAISWSPDGSRIAGAMAGGNASLFEVYDTTSKHLLLSFEQAASPFDMLWSGDSSQLATVYAQEIYLRDIASGNIVSSFSVAQYTSYSLTAIAWDKSINQRLYGLIGGEQRIIVWDASSREVEEIIPISVYAEPMTLSPDFSKLAVGTIDGSGEILILDAFDGTQLGLLDAENPENLQALVWNIDNITLASFSGNYNGGTIRVWDTITSNQINVFTVNHYISPETLLLHGDDEIITNTIDGTILIISLPSTSADQLR